MFSCGSLQLRNWCLIPLAVVALLGNSGLGAAETTSWEFSPYRVQLELVVDAKLNPNAISVTNLGRELERRIHSTLYPIWNVTLVIPTGADRQRILAGDEFPEDLVPEASTLSPDKRMRLGVIQELSGTRLVCREFDEFTQRWTPPLECAVHQELLLSQQCLEIICRAFAPLAKIEVLPEDKSHVLLKLKGSKLFNSVSADALVRVEDVFQPFLVRNTPGSSKSTQFHELPWTYVTVEKPSQEHWLGKIDSGMRAPFGAGRQGRIEVMALAIKNPLPATQVRFHATQDESEALVGFEIWQRGQGDSESKLLGYTDELGSILVQRPQGAPVLTLFVRSDTQLLAKVPVLPGASREVKIPLVDDRARILAQAEINTLRENLIDIMARRNILMARIRKHLGDSQIDEAKSLLADLNELPTRVDFENLLSLAERNPRHRSENPRVQLKIDGLFAEMRSLLGRFLNVSEITQIESEVLGRK